MWRAGRSPNHGGVDTASQERKIGFIPQIADPGPCLELWR
jgi:hypothetical protein